MLASTAEEIRPRAEALAQRLAAVAGLSTSVEAAGSEPGSGSAPGIEIPTFVVRAVHAKKSASVLAARLRESDPPVFARIHDDALLLDPRTLLEGDEEDLVRAFATASAD
jgi:L-seryl-tRNA(Ser) seleniumtransferase